MKHERIENYQSQERKALARSFRMVNWKNPPSSFSCSSCVINHPSSTAIIHCFTARLPTTFPQLRSGFTVTGRIKTGMMSVFITRYPMGYATREIWRSLGANPADGLHERGKHDEYGTHKGLHEKSDSPFEYHQGSSIDCNMSVF